MRTPKPDDFRDMWLCAGCAEAESAWTEIAAKAPTASIESLRRLKRLGDIHLDGAMKIHADHECDCCEEQSTGWRTLFYLQPVLRIRAVC